MIQVCEPVLGQEEIDNVSDCIKSGRISGYGGKYIDEFERGLAEYCGVNHAVAVTNCGAATLLTLEAAQQLGRLDTWGKATQVVMPAFTMAAPAFAIIRAGFVPVLVDAEEKTYNMDLDKLLRVVNQRTCAIVAAHVYGQTPDMAKLMQVARQQGLAVIEDAAEALGAQCDGRRAGSFGLAGNFSFYFNKTMTTGEGGAVVTNDKELADHVRYLKGYATDPGFRFLHGAIGFNFRMSNLEAAVGCAQIKKLPAFVEAKRRIAARYNRNLGDISGVVIPNVAPWAYHSYWVYAVRVEAAKRDRLIEKMAEKGVETRRFFTPMHKQPALAKYFKGEHYPVAEKISAEGLYLPNGCGLTDEQVDFISDVFRDAYMLC